MSHSHIPSRRAFLQSVASLAALASARRSGAQAAKGRVIILGFDGVEPSIVEQMLAAGELPNLAAIRDKGAYRRLGTTLPPQSPVAWTSFATGTLPGEHGVFDFVIRDPQSYLTGAGFGEPTRPEFGSNGELTKEPVFMTRRVGRTFWDIADEQGARATVLNVPFITPPDDLEHGHVLCSLGVTDIRGASSFSFSLSDRYTTNTSVAGGLGLPIKFDGNSGESRVPAMPALWPIAPDGSPRGDFIELPVKMTVDRDNHVCTIQCAGKAFRLSEGMWSEWFPCQFEVTQDYIVHAISRFMLVEAGEHVNLYLTSLQFHPEHPFIPFSSPSEYSAELKKRYGLYKTIGWAYDTHALRQDRITEDEFLDEVWETMAWRERLCLDELDKDDTDLFISVWTATDRVAHMFWRCRDKLHPLYTAEGNAKYGDIVEKTYKRMDAIVGEVVPKLRDEDALFIISDHGFGSYRYAFNLNTWLVRMGYAFVIGQRSAATAYGTRGGFLQDFDWPRTRAYAIGLSSLYLNVRGRERNGIVPENEAEALRRELREKLLEVVCPQTGEKIFTEIYIRGNYKGDQLPNTPDLVLAYKPGYESSKPTLSGGVPPDVFEPCDDKWSGEHSGNDAVDMPGILFCNRPIETQTPHIIDVAPTALRYLNKQVPVDFEGQPLF